MTMLNYVVELDTDDFHLIKCVFAHYKKGRPGAKWNADRARLDEILERICAGWRYASRFDPVSNTITLGPSNFEPDGDPDEAEGK